MEKVEVHGIYLLEVGDRAPWLEEVKPVAIPQEDGVTLDLSASYR